MGQREEKQQGGETGLQSGSLNKLDLLLVARRTQRLPSWFHPQDCKTKANQKTTEKTEQGLERWRVKYLMCKQEALG